MISRFLKDLDQLVRDSKVGKIFEIDPFVEKMKKCGKNRKAPFGGFSHYTLISSVTSSHNRATSKRMKN
jgi:hypothetical protein